MGLSRNFAVFSVLAALAFAGCSSTDPVGAKRQPIPVRVHVVQPERIPLVLEAPGSVVPRDRIHLSSQVSGFVREVRVKEGDPVSAGQVLLTLDARDAEAQREAAESGLTEAQAAMDEANKAAVAAARARAGAEAATLLATETYERYQKLSETRSVSAHELSEVRANRDRAIEELAARQAMAMAAQDRVRQAEQKITQARAMIKRAEVYLSWTVVRSPSAGTVSSNLVDAGSAIHPGTPLLRLDSRGKSQVVADLPSGDAAALKPGLDVLVRFAGAGSRTIPGRVTEINPTSTPGTHTVRFKVDLKDDADILVGIFARVLIRAGERSAILVPRKSILESGQLVGAFTVDSRQSARYRLVKTVAYDHDRVEVLTGLDSGDRLVLDPPAGLVEGSPLEIRP